METEPTGPPYDFLGGALLLIDKPQGWTSFDVVNKVRYRLKKALGIKKIKVGHSGTLDPMATGLLVLCTGKWTKRLTELTGLDKQYTGTLKLGETTPSYDADTKVDEIFPTDHITPVMVHAATAEFVGDLQQVPPVFSAIKVDGQPLYKRARKGEKVEVKSRQVRVDRFEITGVDVPDVHFAVDCGKGTYVRSLAYDLGRALDSGAHLTALRRTRVGIYDLADAWNLDDLLQHIDDNAAPAADQG
ncbi:MAG: tRNA pseudouridine(55) synthase TruB [Saprospiraceae bacterium]